MEQLVIQNNTVSPPVACPNFSGSPRILKNIQFCSKGFSLIEIIIVLALAALLGGIAVFYLAPAIKNYRLNGAAHLVMGDFQNAKTIALKENRSIRIDLTTTGYSFVRTDSETTIFSRNLSSEYPNVSINKQGGGSILFTSTGQTSAAVVHVQGDSGTKTLTIGWTGRIVLS
jgi:type II secretion system protein H